MRLVNRAEAVQDMIDTFGKDYEVLFHNSGKADLDESSFRFPMDAGSLNEDGTVSTTGMRGVYLHTGTDDYFDRYGGVVYAVLINKVHKPVTRILGDEDGNTHTEIFATADIVKFIVEL